MDPRPIYKAHLRRAGRILCSYEGGNDDIEPCFELEDVRTSASPFMPQAICRDCLMGLGLHDMPLILTYPPNRFGP